MSSRTGLLRRLTARVEDLEAESLRARCVVNDATPADVLTHGQQVEVFGRLHSVSYNPRQHVATLQAELFDGSGTVHLVWLGRRRIAGIEPGRTMRACGRVRIDEDGPTIYNPRYELLSG